MKKKLIVIFLIAIIFSTFPLFSKEKINKRVYLDSGWKYSLIQNSTSNIPIDNSSFSQLSTLYADYSGYIYLKNTFYLQEPLQYEQLGVYIGQIKIAAEVYINNVLVGTSGQMPPNEFYSGEKPAAYYIPSEILNYGIEQNEILIKLWVNGYGKISPKPYIDLWSEVQLAQKRNNMFSSELPFAASVFLGLVSLLYLFFYLIRPKDRSNLSFGLLTLFSSLYLLTISWGEYPVRPLTSFLTFQKIFNGLIPFAAMHFAVSFIRDYLNKKENYKFRFFRAIGLIFTTIVPLFAQNLLHFFLLQVICYFFSGFMFLYPTALIFEDIFKKNKKVFSLLIGFSPILIGLFSAGILFLLFDFQYTRLVIIFGWLFTIVIFLDLLLVNYVKLFGRVEFVNANLEKIVKNKTQQLQNANQILEETNTHLNYEKNRTAKELELAAYVQHNFYKLRKTDFDDWEVGYYFRPLESVSGDLYDLYTINDKLKGLGIFDVSGHGISSGLVTMLVKNIIQQEFDEGINDELCSVMNKINERIINEKGSIENYLTGIICRLEKNTMEFISAGHPEPIYIHKNKVSILPKATDAQGVIGIGGVPTNFVSSKLEFQKDDLFIMYTDGFTEATNEYNQLFGKERLLSSIQNHYDLPLSELVKAITDDVFDYSKDSEIKDDLTLIILKKK